MSTLSPLCPCGALLVGRHAADDTEAALRLAATHLGRHLKRIPDGETGVRWHWISWQYPLLKSLDFVEPEPREDGKFYTAGGERWRLKPGVDASRLAMPPLGYAAHALESYATFARLKRAGTIPPHTRFQVSLPTPLAPIHAIFATGSQAAIEPAYERAMLDDVARIAAAIPHDQLAIQWDVAIEFAILEGVLPTFIRDPETAFAERLARIAAAVPAGVELGFHLCYGDSGGKHFKQPEDTAKLVAMANRIDAAVARSIEWLHLPVPIDRTDAAYFAPLADLRLRPETELYLGLVHLADGAGGTQKRIDAARAVVPRFGIATECGLGRQPRATIGALLDLHASAAAPLSGSG
jgi:hypothetical protein